MSKLKEQQIITHSTIVDAATGECLEHKTTDQLVLTRFSSSVDNFIQVYLEDLSGLLSIASKTELHVLAFLWKASYFNEKDQGNCIAINQKLYTEIAEALNLKEQSVRNIIYKLSTGEKKLLIKDSRFRGIYYLNPTYFFKGALKDRPKALKVVLEYINTETE